MKNKYQRLSKEERKQARIDFAASNDLNKAQSKRLRRAMVTGIIGILYGLVFIIYSLVVKGFWYEYITYSFVLIFGIGLFFKARDFYGILINKYLIEEAEKTVKKVKKNKK